MPRLSLATPNPIDYFPASSTSSGDLPWIPIAPGKAWKPLRFFADGRGFVQLLRMEPGSASPLHRHTGEVHAFNLCGRRELGSGEIVGPGDYVYEQAGNVDSWKVVGDETLIVLVVVTGRVEFIDPDSSEQEYLSAQSQMKAYQAHCREHGIALVDLVD
jgi:anti-sigma factor ChrR (cupin superfamily)